MDFFAQPARWCVLASLSALLAACGPSEVPAASAAPAARPPAQVGVVVVRPVDVGLVTELPGRLEASRVAQVRARTAGILQERLFREGSEVKAGQPLFRIDAAPYEAALQSAKANLQRAEVSQATASALAERYRPLAEARAISELEYTNALAAKRASAADVAVATAAVRTARIQVDYAQVTAPIAGRIGRALVTEGALVGQGEPTQLAVIQQINPMYVNFTQSASEALRIQRAMAQGQLKTAGANAARVRVVLEDGSEYALPGRLLFSDLTVDATTGQVTLRAEVPNPQGVLLPGLYVRVRLEQATAPQAMTLPQQAVTRSAQGDTVMVVDGQGKVSPRNVTVGGEQNGQWVVLDGLQAGEQVMVDGFQKLRGGGPVQAVPWSPPGSASADGKPAAAPAK